MFISEPISVAVDKVGPPQWLRKTRTRFWSGRVAAEPPPHPEPRDCLKTWAQRQLDTDVGAQLCHSRHELLDFAGGRGVEQSLMTT